MICTSQHLSPEFVTRSCVFLSFIYVSALIEAVFLALTHLVCHSKDNRANSLFGLLFIFSPLLTVLACATGIVTEWTSSGLSSEAEVRKILTVSYTFSLLASVVQFVIVCNFAGTTRPGDSAYTGLVNRYLC